jgi:hypothetical protein
MNYPTDPAEPATGQTLDHRADPCWQAARAAFVAEMTDDEDPDEVYARQVTAAFKMWQSEKSCAESAAPASGSFDRDRAYRSAEVTWWRAATDDGRDTAFGRRLAAEQHGAVPS